MTDTVRAGIRWESSGEGQVIAKAQQIGTAIEGAQNKSAVAGRAYVAQMEDFARAGAKAADIARLTGGSLANARESIILYGNTVAKTTDEVMGLAAAQQEMATANLTATTSFNAAGAGLGRVRQGLTSLVASATGTIPVLDRLGGVALQGFGIGLGPMIAILGGVAALAFAYKDLTKFSREQQEAQDKQTESLRKWHEEQQRGLTGEREAQLAAAKTKLATEQSTLATLQARVASPTMTHEGVASAEQTKQLRDQAAEIAKTKADIAAATQDITNIIAKAAKDQDAIRVSDLASLIASNHATTAERENAINLLKGYEQSLASLTANRPEMQSQRVALIADIKALNDALYPKSAAQASPLELTSNAIVNALVKQLDEMRKVNAEDTKAITLAEQNAELAHRVGLEHDLLANAYKAENEIAAAALTLSGLALADRVAAIRSIEQLDAATITYTASLKDRVEMEKQVAAIGAKNKEITDRQQTQTAEAIKAQQKYADDMQRIWTSGFEKIITDGTKSFHDFFEDVLQMFTKMIARMQQAGKGDEIGAKLLGIGSAAIGGGFAGYQIGQSTGNAIGGILGGAASGAALGASAGPWGAIIGGLAGAAGGLLGAADAQKQAAKELQAAAVANNAKIESFAAAGQGQVQQQLAALYDNKIALHEATLALANAMLKNGEDGNAYYRSASDTINASYTQQKDKIASDFFGGITKQLNALSGPAGEYQNQLIAINEAYAENIRSASALHATAEQQQQITDLYNASLKALNDTMEKANTTAQKGYQGRQIAALFGSDSDQAFSFQQAQELADAVAQGLDPQTIAMLKQTQLMEAAARERQKQTQILQDQLTAANNQLSSLHTQEDQQKQTIATLQATMQTIQKGADALKIGDLSALTPAEQYAESLRQLQAFVAKAQAGDQNAAQDVIGAANTFLQESKMMYASSEPYGQDFAYVQSLLSGLGMQYNDQLTTAEKMLAALQDQEKLLVAQIQIMNAQLQQSAYDAALARQTYVRGAPGDPNFLGGNAYTPGSFGADGQPIVNDNGSFGNIYPYSGMPAGLPPWDPSSPAGQALARAMGAGTTSSAPHDTSMAAYSAWISKVNSDSGRSADWGTPYEQWLAEGAPAFAMGGRFGGGMRWVGERGPELEITGPSQIINNSDSRNLVASMTGLSADLLTEIKALREDMKTASKQGMTVDMVTGNALGAKLDKLIARADNQARLTMFADRNTGTG